MGRLKPREVAWLQGTGGPCPKFLVFLNGGEGACSAQGTQCPRVLYSEPMTPVRPSLTPQPLGTQPYPTLLLPGLLWVWPALLGEGCGPGSPLTSFLSLLLGLEPVTLWILGK